MQQRKECLDVKFDLVFKSANFSSIISYWHGLEPLRGIGSDSRSSNLVF